MNPKVLVTPLQQWLLTHGWCVGCGRPLIAGQKKKHPENGAFQITCQCRRVYLYHPEEDYYRRALIGEAAP